MIEQHYYTKTKEGTMGTVAKSSQLKGEYIDKILKPLCEYDIPQELKNINEQDETQYPPCMMIVPRKTGELIISQSVYKNYNATFFTHQFILSEYEKRRFLKEPEKIFGINNFKRGFDESSPLELPTLAGLSYHADNPDFLDRAYLFSKIGFTEEIFNQLLSSIFVAVASKRKIFIVLNVPVERLGNVTKALLYHLYLMLPWQVTEELGICTYSGQMKVRKNIHITFLDQQAIQEDTHFGKNIIFDFVHDRFINIKQYDPDAIYLRGAVSYYKNKPAWEKINTWAIILSNTLLHKSKRTIQFYGHVVILVEMSMCVRLSKPYVYMTPKIRKGLLARIFSELIHSQTSEIRRELLEITEYTIQLLQEDVDTLFSLEELRTLLRFKLEYYQSQEQEKHCIQTLLNLLKVAREHKNYAYIYQLLDEVHLYEETYQHLFKAIYEDESLRKEIIYYLIQDSFKEVKTFEDVMEQMACFEEVEFILLQDYYYAQVVYRKFRESLKEIKDLVAFLEKLRYWVSEHQKMLYINLLEQGEYYFLERIQLGTIPSERALCQLKFNRSYTIENYEVIKLYQRLRTDIKMMSPDTIRLSGKVQQLIKMYYSKSVTKKDFYMIVYAFLERDLETQQLYLNIKNALAYLNEVSYEVMLDFIVWIAGQEMYIEKETFEQEVIAYFISLKEQDILIDKELISAKLGTSVKTHRLNSELMTLLQPNLMTFLKQYKKWIVAVILLIVIGSSLHLWNQNKVEDEAWIYQKAIEKTEQ